MVELIAERWRQAEAKCLPEDLDAWEAEAMRNVLGERSDWAPGIGPLIPKRDLFSVRRREYEASSSSSTSHVAQGKINELQSVVRSLVDIVTTSMALPSEIAEKLMRFTGEASASQGHSHRSTMHALSNHLTNQLHRHLLQVRPALKEEEHLQMGLWSSGLRLKLEEGGRAVGAVAVGADLKVLHITNDMPPRSRQ